jgi:hypothetical protein
MPRPLFTLGRTRYPLYRRLGGPQGRSGQVRKILPPPGFDPQTVQPVASCHTGYETRPTEEQGAERNISTREGGCDGGGCRKRYSEDTKLSCYSLNT